MGGNKSEERDIELASFLVRAKSRIIILSTIFGYVCCGLVLAYSLWFWGNVYVERVAVMRDFRVFFQNFSAFEQNRVQLVATPLRVIGTSAFTKSNGNMDVVALVENMNTRWSVHVDYHFQGEPKGSMSAMVVRPKERRFLGRYDSVPLAAASPELVLEAIRFERVSEHTIPDVTQFIKERAQFNISTPLYKNAHGNQTTDDVSFSITNVSPFSYFEVGLEILLYVNDSLVGVETTTVAPLRSGATKEMKIHSPPRGILPTRIEVIPVVDYFSPQSYIQVGK